MNTAPASEQTHDCTDRPMLAEPEVGFLVPAKKSTGLFCGSSRFSNYFLVCFFVICSSARAAVTVTPTSPSSANVITINLQNQFGFEAHVLSASITRVGNTFTIQQNVAAGCSLPSNPSVFSQFVVGPLAPGNYDVLATITFTNVDPVPCFPPPVTQSASFAVVAFVPALSTPMLILLMIFLAFTGVVVMKRV